ncbi:MAG: cation-transporting P-type ATPase [Actinomycetes bacterium]
MEAPETGLTEVEASERLSRYGPNSITTARRRPLWRRVLAALGEPLVLVLLGGRRPHRGHR